jgi:hypothetical protein
MGEGTNEVSRVTVSQLYSIYCAAYAEVTTISEGGLLRPFEIALKPNGLGLLERVILELALHDATNGTAMRSRAAFNRAVEQGAAMLRGLGLCLDREQTDGGAGAPVLGQAA